MPGNSCLAHRKHSSVAIITRVFVFVTVSSSSSLDNKDWKLDLITQVVSTHKEEGKITYF